jgi:dihydrofolate reductase
MSSVPEVVLIAAVARNGVIGDQNRLLWHLPEDMAFFRQATTGHAVIMGRKTWESLPERFRPLPGRRNIVLTRGSSFLAPGAEIAHSIDDALRRLPGESRVFVIGGAQVYAQALPLADELLLTQIDRDFAGDVSFPHWPRTAFTALEQTDHDSGQGFRYCRVRYRRKPAA